MAVSTRESSRSTASDDYPDEETEGSERCLSPSPSKREHDQENSSRENRESGMSRERDGTIGHRARSTSRDREHEHRSRSSSRERDDQYKSRNSSNEQDRKLRARSSSRHRGTSRDRDGKGRGKDEADDDDNGSLVRRRRKTTEEKAKSENTKSGASTYLKNKFSNVRAKEVSLGRKSSILGSLNAFLDESKPAATPEDSADRSVVSSVSLSRRRSRSTARSSGSVVPGKVSSRDEVREKRRAQSPGALHGNKELREKRRSSSSGRLSSKTEGARERRRSPGPLSKPNNSSRTSSKSLPDEESLNPQALEEMPIAPSTPPTRMLRRASMAGPEVPPGFPVAAVDKSSAAPSAETEHSLNSSSTSILESTAKIRQRQQRRASMGNGMGNDPLTPTADEGRNQRFKLRGRRSNSVSALAAREQHASSENGGVPESPGVDNKPTVSSSPRKSRRQSISGGTSVPADQSSPSRLRSSRHRSTQESTAAASEKSEKKTNLGSLEAKLEKIGGHRSSRSRSSGRSVSSAPAVSSKHSTSKKRSSSRSGKKGREALSSRSSSPKDSQTNEDDPVAQILESLPMENDPTTQYKADELNNSSTGSLDPNLLNKAEPAKMITDIHQIYHEESVGVEGEQSLNDSNQDSTLCAEFNQSTTSCNIAQLQQVVAFLGAAASGANISPHSPSSQCDSDSSDDNRSAVLRRKLGQVTAESPGASRVSWVELPLHNPQDLLVKSADTDGANETATTVDSAVIDSVVEDLSVQEDDGSVREEPRNDENKSGLVQTGKSNNNPSLDLKLERNDKSFGHRVAPDEQTVATTYTNASEVTVKTENRSTPVMNSSDKHIAEDLKAADKEGSNHIIDDDAKHAPQSVSSSSLGRRSNHGAGSSSRKNITETESVDRKPHRRSSSKSAISRNRERGSRSDDRGDLKNKDPLLDMQLERKDRSFKYRNAPDEQTVSTTSTCTTENSLETTKSENGPTAENPKVSSNECSNHEVIEVHAKHAPQSGSSSSLGRRSNHSGGSSSRKNLIEPESTDKKPQRRSSSKSAISRNRERGSRSDDRGDAKSKEGLSSSSRRHEGTRERSSRAGNVDIRSGRGTDHVPNGSAHSQSGSEPPEEKSWWKLADPQKEEKTWWKLNETTSNESSDAPIRRKKSYLPRKISKVENERSKDQKSTIGNSLDNFLAQMDANSIVKDDNRSVYSQLEYKDHKRRLRDKKREEMMSRRINRPNNIQTKSEDEDDSEDEISVLSAPMLSSKQARKMLEKEIRPVVSLHKTKFSSRLKKLDVAF